MRVIHLPPDHALGSGPFVQFTDDEHEQLDEALSHTERSIMESPNGLLRDNAERCMKAHNLRDSLHPVWREIKELEEIPQVV